MTPTPSVATFFPSARYTYVSLVFDSGLRHFVNKDTSLDMDKSTSSTTIAEYKKNYIFTCFDQRGGGGQGHSNFPVPYFKGDGDKFFFVLAHVLRCARVKNPIAYITGILSLF